MLVYGKNISSRFVGGAQGSKNKFQIKIDVGRLFHRDRDLDLNSDINMSKVNIQNDREILIPLHMRKLIGKFTPSFIKNDVKLLNKYDKRLLTSGFKGYETCLSISGIDLNSISGIRRSIMKEIGEMLDNLEEGKVYTLLLIVFDVNSKNYSSILPNSLYIYNKTDKLLFSNVLIKYLVLHSQRYQVISELTLNFLIREWYTKKDVELSMEKKNINQPSPLAPSIKDVDSSMLDLVSYNAEGQLLDNKFDSLINSINTDLVNRNNEIEDKINLKEDKFAIHKQIKYLRKRCIAFRLNPYIISNLNIISGDFNYTLYSLNKFTHFFIDKDDIFKNNVRYEFTLLELNDKFYNTTKKNYFIIQSKYLNCEFGLTSSSSEVLYTWTDYIDYKNDTITRYYLDNKIEFYLPLNSLEVIEDIYGCDYMDSVMESKHGGKWKQDLATDPLPAPLGERGMGPPCFSWSEGCGARAVRAQRPKVSERGGRRNYIKNIELKFNFPNYLQTSKDYIRDDKIGVIDFETLNYNGDGNQIVYSGGWAVKNYRYINYIEHNNFSVNFKDNSINYDCLVDKTASPKEDNRDYKLLSYNLIKNLVDNIFDSDYYKYTFFVHNLGNFDYIFLLAALSYFDEYELKPIIKEDNNILVSLKISKIDKVLFEKDILNEDGELLKKIKKTKNVRKTIKILDSNQIIPGKLRNLSKEFNCDKKKGFFPYKFMSIKNLDYIGDVPSYEYFSDSMDLNEYTNWKKSFQNIYDIKKETIKYLENDLFSLLDVVTKFSNIVFKRFSMNITKYKTISSLALHTFLSSYYEKDYNLKIIKGFIEKEIRYAYFGGLVFTKSFHKHKGKAYVYDVNSHYPNAMLESMPVGNPVLSTSKNLDSYFGYVYAEIIPPKNLDVYFIPYRDVYGNIVKPNYIFKGLYFSELLKESRKYGYQINVLWGYKFEKGEYIFKNFVEELYKERLLAKSNKEDALQLAFKLILNSVYGRFGMKNIDNKLVILNKNEAEIIMNKKNITYYSELNDKVILRYNNNVNREILQFTDKDINSNSNIFVDKIKQRGATSSIPIAAAITSWGLIKMLKYLNIPNNKLIYSDTDSVTLEKPLDDKYLSSNELGKMKLEYILKEGIYISPKFYAIKTENGEEINKTKGISKGKYNFEDFERLYKGEDLTVTTTVFRKNLSQGTLNVKDVEYTIKGNPNPVTL